MLQIYANYISPSGWASLFEVTIAVTSTRRNYAAYYYIPPNYDNHTSAFFKKIFAKCQRGCEFPG